MKVYYESCMYVITGTIINHVTAVLVEGLDRIVRMDFTYVH